MRAFDWDYLVYAVTGKEFHPGRSLPEAVEAALMGGASVMQLREKHATTEELTEIGKTLLPLCHRYNVPLIVNDDVEAAYLCNADGVHIGQSDMALQQTRRKLGAGKIIGVSAQTVEQALQAERDGADYLGVGAVFPTGSKPDADAVPLAVLKAITQAVHIPVVAIGGISADNIARLADTGIQGVAVISAIFGAPDIASAARELRALAERCLR